MRLNRKDIEPHLTSEPTGTEALANRMILAGVYTDKQELIRGLLLFARRNERAPHPARFVQRGEERLNTFGHPIRPFLWGTGFGSQNREITQPSLQERVVALEAKVARLEGFIASLRFPGEAPLGDMQ